MKNEFVQTEEECCQDCRMDKDYCCDCTEGTLYKSPDIGEDMMDRIRDREMGL